MALPCRANLRAAVKTFRTWLLVLLAVLLPIRGTVAAAMLCSSSGPGITSERNVASASAQHLVAHTPQSSHDGHHHAHHAAGADDAARSAIEPHHGGGIDQHHGGVEKCNLCCDFCSVTPLFRALPSVPTPPDPGRVAFPEPIAAAASFLSDGQERPPRSS